MSSSSKIWKGRSSRQKRSNSSSISLGDIFQEKGNDDEEAGTVSWLQQLGGRSVSRNRSRIARGLYNKYSNDIKWFIQSVEGLLQYLNVKQKDLMNEVENQTSYMRRREAATEVLIDRLIEKEGGNKDKALLIIVSDKVKVELEQTRPDQPLLKKEHVVLNFVNALLQRDARPVFFDDNNQYPLHHAVKRGFREVVRKLLDYDAYPLEKDKAHKMPLHLALEKEEDEIATLILKQMPNNEVIKLFLVDPDKKVDSDKKPDSFKKVESGKKPDSFKKVDSDKKLDSYKKVDSDKKPDSFKKVDSDKKLDSYKKPDSDKKPDEAECKFHDILRETKKEGGKEKKKEMTNTALEILTCMIDIDEQSQKVQLDYSLLESDANGRSSDHLEFKKGSETAFQLIAKTRNKDVACHFVMKRLVEQKWNAFAKRRFILKFLVFLLSIFFMTFAAVSGVLSSDPTHYDLPIDIARAVCEVGALMMVFSKLCAEVFQMGRRGIEYFKEVYNYIDLASVFCILAVVPLRWYYFIEQWQVFGVGYLFWTFRIFKYAVVSNKIGAYCQILWQVITRDFPQFTIVFVVILLAFSGSFLLILKGENSLDVHAETSNFWEILFTGVRILTEGGPVVDYTGPDGYKVMSTILSVAFLFVSIVMLLNILIAQLSDTYEKVQQDAEREFVLNRMWIITRMEKNSVFNQCCNRHQLKETLDESDWSSEMDKREEDYSMQKIDNGLASTQLDISFLKSKLSKLENIQENQLRKLEIMQENQQVLMNGIKRLASNTTE